MTSNSINTSTCARTYGYSMYSKWKYIVGSWLFAATMSGLNQFFPQQSQFLTGNCHVVEH